MLPAIVTSGLTRVSSELYQEVSAITSQTHRPVAIIAQPQTASPSPKNLIQYLRLAPINGAQESFRAMHVLEGGVAALQEAL